MPSNPIQDLAPINSVSADVIFASEATSSPRPDTTSSEQCTLERPCEGDMTWFEAGLGACGMTSDGYTQNVVALAPSLIGTKANDNPYCNRTIMITCITTGRTTSAIVADKCEGCEGFSLDLSIAAFLNLADLSVGRTKASWYFI
ncbi:hypothetical protein DL95DRAFT_469716 [Leptodontidium sp. 2 PMI_412]|nr:hypothetical protein DL95DRAFT_469716 [Leptodontidium sp. 2 PMI_412]